MMKRALPCLLVLVFCLTSSWAGIADDGLIETGEYDYGVINLENQDLLVTGGGAYRIHAKGFSNIEVQNTSPLSNTGGITQLISDNTSHLEVYGGDIGSIILGHTSTVELYGGEILSIFNLQLLGEVGRVSIYCQPGWSWLYDDVITNQIVGITGQWKESGNTFSIDFVDDDVYPPTWQNINVIPEPTTMALLGLGGLLIRKRK